MFRRLLTGFLVARALVQLRHVPCDVRLSVAWLVLLVLVISLAVAACGTSSSIEGPDAASVGASTAAHENGTPPTSDAVQRDAVTVQEPEPDRGFIVQREAVGGREVIFVKLRPGSLTGAIGTGGELVVDDEGCLRTEPLDGGLDYVLVWPADFGLSIEGGEIRILDNEGRVAAQVGDYIAVGGASGAEERDLPEECRRGEHWIVGLEVCADEEPFADQQYSSQVPVPYRLPPDKCVTVDGGLI